jgi:hypothetical protein
VVDDLHRADEASLLLWHRLIAASRRMPLLLVAAVETERGRPELTRLRQGVEDGRGHVLPLDPLPTEDIQDLVAGLVGAPLGPHLAALARHVAGNPLCAEQMTAVLLRRGLVCSAGGQADVDASVIADVPHTREAAIRANLESLPGGTAEILRQAALLGTGFTTDDVVAVTGLLPFDLIGHLEAALSDGVLVDTGPDLAFRHPLVRQALHASIPPDERPARRRRAAEALDATGRPVTRVAEQLAAETPAVDEWVVRWTVQHHAELMRRAPRLGVGLVRQVLDSVLPDTAQRAALLTTLVRADPDQQPTSVSREALKLAADPDSREEMRHALARAVARDGDLPAALRLLDGAVRDPGTPERWRLEHRMLAASLRRGDLTDTDRAEESARKLYAQAIEDDKAYEAAHALQTSWLARSIRRDHENALLAVDRALNIVRGRPDLAGLLCELLGNRILTLQALDRLDEADSTLRDAAVFAIRHGFPIRHQAASATQCYWRGRWADARAEIAAATDDTAESTGPRAHEAGADLVLLNGVGALLAAHGGNVDLAAEFLAAADTPQAAGEPRGFLLVARAVAAEQRHGAAEALTVLEPVLGPDQDPTMPQHRWLPYLVRLALGSGRADLAERAAAICSDEERMEVPAAGAHAAAARCRALMTGDPEPALTAATRYRDAGRVVECAAALEDAAVLSAASRRPHEAARIGEEAAGLYATLGAAWDRGRTRDRLAEYGIALEAGSAASPRR